MNNVAKDQPTTVSKLDSEAPEEQRAMLKPPRQRDQPKLDAETKQVYNTNLCIESILGEGGSPKMCVACVFVPYAPMHMYELC
jgi:hypothetical protein